MGNIISTLLTMPLRGVAALSGMLLGRPAGSIGAPSCAGDSPGLPVDSPTAPYWLDDPPFPELVAMRSPALPEKADVVVVGSGITGAAVARTVLHERRRRRGGGGGGGGALRVVVLEARDLCSGATGRNGGHIKVSPHEVFGRLRKNMAPERAAALIRFQLSHLELLVGMCRDEGFDVAECREVDTADLYMDPALFEEAVGELKLLRKWLPELEVSVWDAGEARKRLSVNSFVAGAISYKAGALWPYRLVTSVWRRLLDEFPHELLIETRTPASGVASDHSDPEFPYHVSTNRGVIRTKHVVHATNAFASHLVPGFRGKMTSLLGHMSAQRPGNKFPGHNGQQSWSIMYGGGFDYVSQRPTVDGVPGDLLVGGGFDQSSKHGMDQIGIYDDSKVDAMTVAHILGILPTIFEPDWGADVEARVKKIWTGVIALTADSLPFVGPLDARLTGRKAPGAGRGDQNQGREWTASGFFGEGMVWAWLSGTALGLMISGSADEDLPAAPGRPVGRLSDWFPDELLATYERVARLNLPGGGGPA